MALRIRDACTRGLFVAAFGKTPKCCHLHGYIGFCGEVSLVLFWAGGSGAGKQLDIVY